jgi:hypothetical protein
MLSRCTPYPPLDRSRPHPQHHSPPDPFNRQADRRHTHTQWEGRRREEEGKRQRGRHVLLAASSRFLGHSSRVTVFSPTHTDSNPLFIYTTFPRPGGQASAQASLPSRRMRIVACEHTQYA